MPKPVRAVLACCALLLAASLTISAASDRAAGPNPAFVVFWLAPKKIVCLGEKAPLIVSYEWDMDSGLVPLTPLFPLKPKRGAKTPEPPGKLTLRGDLAGQLASISVGYGPGKLYTDYKAKAAGSETLTTTLTYSPYTDKDTRAFEIKKCDYNLVIKAWNDVDQSGTVITSYFSAEGKISIDENGVVSGELRTDAWFDIDVDDPVLSCVLVPLPMAIGKLTVSGTRTTDDSGQATINLTITYGKVEGFPESVGLDCFDKIKQEKIPTDTYRLPPSDTPGQYLRSTLNFVNETPLTGTFGKGGHSDYILEKLQ